MKQIRARGVLTVNLVMDIPRGGDYAINPSSDEVDDRHGVDFSVGKGLQRCGGSNRSASPIDGRVERPESFGDRIAELTGGVDDLVKLEVQVAKVSPDDTPMSLLALQMQFDEINQYSLKVIGQGRGCDEAFLCILALCRLRILCRSRALTGLVDGGHGFPFALCD
jgi:hypothetical protein